MDYLRDIQDPSTVARLIPYLEQAATAHQTVHEIINLITDKPDGMRAVYATKIELLRKAIEGLLHEQRMIALQRIEVEERAMEAVYDLIQPQRFPSSDEHE